MTEWIKTSESLPDDRGVPYQVNCSVQETIRRHVRRERDKAISARLGCTDVAGQFHALDASHGLAG